MPLLSSTQLARLRQLLADASTALAVSVHGHQVDDAELQRLVDEGWIDPEDLDSLTRDGFEAGAVASRDDATRPLTWPQYQQHLRALPWEPGPVEQRAIEAAQTRAGSDCVGLGNRWSSALGDIVVNADAALEQRMRGIIRDAVAEAAEKRKSIGALRSDLRQLTQDWGRDWDRIAHTELHNAYEDGYFEDARARHGDEAAMAKIPDTDACDDCRRLYLGPDGLPAVHPMSWWDAQPASNRGVRRQDWKPVKGAVHSWCRCRGQRVPVGWHFDEAGDLVPMPVGKSISGGDLKKGSGGPYIGPRGGRWADPAHTIPYQEPSGRTGTIRVPHALVADTVERFSDEQKWHRKGVLIGDLKTGMQRIELTDASGKTFPVIVIMRQNGNVRDERGISGSHHITGNAKSRDHTIYLDVHPNAAKYREGFEETLRSVLAHELAHASDPGIAVSAMRRKKAGSSIAHGQQNASDHKTYYNEPKEITARTHQIYRELNDPAAEKEAIEEHARRTKNSRNPEDAPVAGETIEHMMQWSPTWQKIEEYLTPENRKRILRMAARIVTAHIRGESTPLAKAHRLHYRTEFQGLPISVENRKGSVRHWHDPHNDEDGRTRMEFAYGYIRGTLGGDGEHLDCYIGPRKDATHAYIVTQKKAPEFKQYDEQKVMLGFDTEAEARTAYLSHYNDSRFLGSMTAMPMEEFKRKIAASRERDGAMIKAHKPGPGQLGLFGQTSPKLTVRPGPYVGPRGGKWADPQHTVHWEDRPAAPPRIAQAAPSSARTEPRPEGQKDLKIVRILSIMDTREHEIIEGPGGRERSVPIPGSGVQHECHRCGKSHEVHAEVELSDGSKRTMGTGCARQTDPDVASRIKALESATKTVGRLSHQLATEQRRLEEMDELRGRATAEVEALPRPSVEKTTRKRGVGRDRDEVEVWTMGDASVWIIGERDHYHLQERGKTLERIWEENRLKERGYEHHKLHRQREIVNDLETRLNRAKKKRDNLLEEQESGALKKADGVLTGGHLWDRPWPNRSVGSGGMMVEGGKRPPHHAHDLAMDTAKVQELLSEADEEARHNPRPRIIFNPRVMDRKRKRVKGKPPTAKQARELPEHVLEDIPEVRGAERNRERIEEGREDAIEAQEIGRETTWWTPEDRRG